MSNDPSEPSPTQAWTLTTCDREPIHIPGLIQSHGYLLAVDERDRRIAMVSANCEAIFGVPPDQLIGGPLDVLFKASFGEKLLRELSSHRLSTDPLLLFATERIGERTFDVVAHRNDGLTIIEFEPVERERQATFAGLYPFVQDALSKLRLADTPQELGRLAAEVVREITGFDRVLIYRFDDDGNGTVTAESSNGVLPSYLSLRFPASDIPRQARELYKRNRQRLIVDAAYTPVPLVPALNPTTGRPLDMREYFPDGVPTLYAPAYQDFQPSIRFTNWRWFLLAAEMIALGCAAWQSREMLRQSQTRRRTVIAGAIVITIATLLTPIVPVLSPLALGVGLIACRRINAFGIVVVAHYVWYLLIQVPPIHGFFAHTDGEVADEVHEVFLVLVPVAAIPLVASLGTNKPRVGFYTLILALACLQPFGPW